MFNYDRIYIRSYLDSHNLLSINYLIITILNSYIGGLFSCPIYLFYIVEVLSGSVQVVKLENLQQIHPCLAQAGLRIHGCIFFLPRIFFEILR